MSTSRILSSFAFSAILALLVTPLWADPLPNEVLKFQQLPLNNGINPSGGPSVPGVQAFPGHDEWSTALIDNSVVPNNGNSYRGNFMADDFADLVSTPVVHIKWWGSYDQNVTGNAGVQKFLISFESDVPSNAAIPGSFSHPGTPLLTEIVTPGAITPASGTFTEQLINGNMPEHLYQYNAELAVPFQEQANTVYWLKIVALVNPANTADGPIKWGWHDRDWGIKDTLASTVATGVTPGENVIGTVVNSAGTNDPVWHFQDDAVSGGVDINIPNQPSTLFQYNMNPEDYIYGQNGAIGVDGPQGIQAYSKDLAFELYTTPVPEPSTILTAIVGSLGVLAMMRLRKKANKGAMLAT